MVRRLREAGTVTRSITSHPECNTEGDLHPGDLVDEKVKDVGGGRLAKFGQWLFILVFIGFFFMC